MGGSIGITIREEDGTIHKMCRWTNSMPYFFRSIKFIEKDKEYLKEYLNVWYEMVKEYEDAQNGIKPLPEITMVDVYAPFPYLAPMDYGLVVVDYMNNKVLHSQGYSSFVSKINESTIYLELKNPEDSQEWEQLCNQKKLLLESKYYYELNKHEEINKEVSFEEIKSLVSTKERDIIGLDFKIKTEPWEFIRFEEDENGIKNLKLEIEKLGFHFTEKENEMWNEYIERYK